MTESPRPKVALGFLGSVLDAGAGPERWQRWRPSVDLCRHAELPIARVELLVEPRFADLGQQVARDIEHTSVDTRVALHELELADPWDFEEVFAALHDFACAYRFKPEDEDYLVHVTTGTHVQQICLFLLTESRYLPGALVQTIPPEADAAGDPGRFSIVDLDLARYDRLAARFEAEQRDAISYLKSGVQTRNRRFNLTIERLERVATRSRLPLLLTGPTGSGKTLLGRRVYELKKRRRQLSGAFVEVNCATLRGEQAMSTLFGHVQGAFTGAHRARTGLLRTAHRGLLFLDEVGELGSDEQAMLLRALEERRFLPLGSDREVESDFQLVCGSNRDLPAAVAAGRFREDLLARIDVWSFRLPALAERREDLPANLEWELERFARATGSAVSINSDARSLFLEFAASPEATWPGNFRDFNAAVVRMATLAEGGRIARAGVMDEIERLRRRWRAGSLPSGDGERLLAALLGPAKLAAVDPFDRVQLAGVVGVCRRSQSLSEAGRELFAVSRRRRSTVNDADRLRKYLLRFDLTFQDVRDAPRQGPS